MTAAVVTGKSSCTYTYSAKILNNYGTDTMTHNLNCTPINVFCLS